MPRPYVDTATELDDEVEPSRDADDTCPRMVVCERGNGCVQPRTVSHTHAPQMTLERARAQQGASASCGSAGEPRVCCPAQLHKSWPQMLWRSEPTRPQGPVRGSR